MCNTCHTWPMTHESYVSYVSYVIIRVLHMLVCNPRITHEHNRCESKDPRMTRMTRMTHVSWATYDAYYTWPMTHVPYVSYVGHMTHDACVIRGSYVKGSCLTYMNAPPRATLHNLVDEYIINESCRMREWVMIHVNAQVHSCMSRFVVIYFTFRIHIRHVLHSYMSRFEFIYFTFRIPICHVSHLNLSRFH